MTGLSGILSVAGSRLRTALVVAATLATAALAGLMGQNWSTPLLVLLAGAAGLLLLLQRPALGLVALAALSFTLPLEIGTGSEVAMTPPVLLIPAITAVWLVDGLRRGAVGLPRSRTVLPLVLFLVSGVVSLLAGRAYWDTLVAQPSNLLLVQLGQWAIFALSAAIFVVAADLGRRGRWLQVTTFIFVLLAGVTSLLWVIPGLWNVLPWGGQANSAMLWAWLAAMATGQLLFNRRLGRAAQVSFLLVLLVGGYVVLGPQRSWLSGWVPFVSAAMVVVWLRIWRQRRAASLVAALALVVLVAVLFPVLYEYAGGEREWQVSGGGRMLLYRRTLELVEAHPILGLGPAAYRHYGFSRWLALGQGRALYLDPRISSHNNYIDVYAQMGLVGLALFLWFLVEMGRVGWRLTLAFDGNFEDGYVQGALGGLAGTLMAMMLVDWFLPFVYNVGFRGFRTSALAWMFLGGLVALEQRDQSDKEGGRQRQGAKEIERGGEVGP